jgi:drug/metabolite transporter (DMT)-like permease
MLNDFLNKKRNLLLLVLIAIFLESFTSPFLKLGTQYPVFSKMYFICFFAAVLVLAFYAIIWQLVLERIPLTTAYLRKGLSYILVFLWASLIFHEEITLKQIIGITVIFIGMVVSISDDD